MTTENANALLPRLRAAPRPPSAADYLDDLIHLHTERPGITEATLGAFTTDDGKSGYDLLVDALPGRARDVLELGCGNGPLLEKLLQRRPPLFSVTGVDACAADLAIARKRLSSERLVLRCEPAQSLGVADASMDAVLSHHAFYLFIPVEPVVKHIARVLRPGGIFSFVTFMDEPSSHPLYTNLLNLFQPLTARENPNFRGWGERRVWSFKGLEGLFFPLGFRAQMDVVQHRIALTEAPAALCDRLMRFFYSVELNSPAAREELRHTWTALLQSHAGDDGKTRLEMPATRVTFTRAGS